MRSHSKETIAYLRRMSKLPIGSVAVELLASDSFTEHEDGFSWATYSDPYQETRYSREAFFDEVRNRQEYWTDIVRTSDES